MAFTLQIIPHNLGDRKMSQVIATYDGVASANHELACTVSQLQLSSLDCFIAEAYSNVNSSSGGQNGLYLTFNRSTNKIEVFVTSLAAKLQAGSDIVPAGSVLRAIAIGA